MLTRDTDHKYRFNDALVPGVTEVLAPFYDFSFVDEDLLAAKSEIGTFVHKATEMFDLGTLDEATLDPVLVPYLDAYKQFLSDTKFRPELIEHYCYHQTFKYAGQLDRAGSIGSTDWVIDLKTTATISPIVGPQTAAYQRALASEAGFERFKDSKRAALRLINDGTYRLVPFADPTDFVVFISMLSIHNWGKKLCLPQR